MYSLEQLNIFVTVCETGSFSGAARQLNRAQSGVSQAISNLEIAFNRTLFDRSRNTPQLTPDGEALLPIVQSILDQRLRLEQKVASLDQQHEHELILVIEESLLDSPLLAALSGLAEIFPNTNINILSASTFDAEDMVREGQAHIGVVYTDGQILTDVDFFALGYKRFITVASPKHPLTQLACVTHADLRQHRQIVQRSTTGKELWFSYGISTQSWYASTHQILCQLAQQNVGWAIVPESLAQMALTSGQLIALNVDFEPNGWVSSIDCITSRSLQAGPVFQAALAQLKQHFKPQTIHTASVKAVATLPSKPSNPEPK
ncbi:LysR family transcriptional regulator [Gilvimarinus polysaccharolyticus]|uniref:LysR family transcriptional regulator n=1 Tax=Gilvimarinus polysaccharolyticus TaxID=863921 RepID=UPI0006733DF3|nr:LysR family transcriptional regulator [Gilvimarinus polysaccharolyticus]